MSDVFKAAPGRAIQEATGAPTTCNGDTDRQSDWPETVLRRAAPGGERAGGTGPPTRGQTVTVRPDPLRGGRQSRRCTSDCARSDKDPPPRTLVEGQTGLE